MDYIEFLLQYGDSALFRDLKRGWYNLSVGPPRIFESQTGELLLDIGYYINGGTIFFKKLEEGTWSKFPYESGGVALRKAGNSFEEWIKRRFQSCKKLYTTSTWNDLANKPVQFSEEETKIIEAAQKYLIEKVGTDSAGNLLVKVFNGSGISLERLTIGVRAKGRLQGKIGLDVSKVEPKQTKILPQSCYKNLVSPERIEVFRLPPPEPEEREMYFELRKGETQNGSSMRRGLLIAEERRN